MPERVPEDEHQAVLAELEAEWPLWLLACFGRYLTTPMAEFHKDFWNHVQSIEAHQRPRPWVSIWPRGAAKSFHAELACIWLGATGRRRYAVYVSSNQDKADDHVESIAAFLETPAFAYLYPAMASRGVSKYGSSRGWRRNRLWTASGFVVDAYGLDASTRGAKLEDMRPDALVIDDVDSEVDTAAAVERRIRILTRRLLPAGTPDLAVLAVQNLVHEGSVFAQLADGRADFLADRIVSGPVPAIRDLEYTQKDGRWQITGGTATWPGKLSLAACQGIIDTEGITAFLSEGQHETEPLGGGMFDHLDFDGLHVSWEQVPALVEVVTACDPAVTSSDHADAHGVQIDGIAIDGTIYRLYSWEHRATPVTAIKTAIRKGAEYSATRVIIETDQGGETWGSVFREAKAAVEAEVEAELLSAADRDEADTMERLASLLSAVRAMTMTSDKAGTSQMSKAARAQNWILPEYERPGPPVRHVLGTHNVLERALRRFPRYKPFDLVDAGAWSMKALRRPLGGGSAADFLASATPWRRR